MNRSPTDLIRLSLLGLALFLNCLSTFAIADTESTNVTVTNDKSWVKKLSGDEGELSFSTSLRQNDVLQIIFSSREKNDGELGAFQLNSTDQNCNGEHETSFSYKESRKNYLIRYFDKKIPWNEKINYSVKWKNKKEFTITVNESSYSIQIAEKPKYIRINTDSNIVLTDFLVK